MSVGPSASSATGPRTVSTADTDDLLSIAGGGPAHRRLIHLGVGTLLLRGVLDAPDHPAGPRHRVDVDPPGARRQPVRERFGNPRAGIPLQVTVEVPAHHPP